MTLSYDYWKDREEKARQQTIKDEDERIKEIEEIYKRMFDEIQRDIDSFFAKYAADEGISIAEAKKRVSKLDMEEFERKAKEYVKNKDFSDQANEEMKLYNLTMKVNRLEMLKAKIGLELVNGYQEIEDYMGECLTETTMKEIERHAGILGKTVGDNQDYAEDIVDASFHNATWSERIWANQDRLKHDLGKLLTSGLIQGKNPRELAKDLQKSMNVSKYDAERLMRTEMCRVQIDASLREIEANGFTQFIFIADSGGSRTCEQCKALDGKTFALKDGKVGVNLPPLHPNCRCSIAGHEDDEDFISWLENHGVELTDEDLEAMGLSRSGGTKDKREVFTAGGDEQYYKNVKLGESSDEVGTDYRGQPITAKKVKSDFGYPADVYLSDAVENFSSRDLKRISEQMVEAMGRMGIKNRKRLPSIVIVGDTELSAAGLASYDIRTNTIKIYQGLGDKRRWKELLEGSLGGGDPSATYIHELYHWIEGEKYIKQNGPVTTREEYIKYMDKMTADGKAFVDRLLADGYDIASLGPYAWRCYLNGKYDEVRTEYRTKQQLGG